MYFPPHLALLFSIALEYKFHKNRIFLNRKFFEISDVKKLPYRA